MSVPEKTKSILFLAVAFPPVTGPKDRFARAFRWFTFRPTVAVGSSVEETLDESPATFADFHRYQHLIGESFLQGLSCAVVDNYLYAVGGTFFGCSVVSESIYRLNTLDPTGDWEKIPLGFPCAFSPVGVYGNYLYILPPPRFHTKFHRKGVEILDTKTLALESSISGLPEGDIRGCAALNGKGFLVVVEGECESKFYIHRPGEKVFEASQQHKSLPKFKYFGPMIPFAVLGDALFILDGNKEEGFMLYAFGVEDGSPIFEQHIKELDQFTQESLNWSAYMVAISDDQLCIMWDGPLMFSTLAKKARHIMRCVKISFSWDPVLAVKDLETLQFNANYASLVDCVPYHDPLQKEDMATDAQSCDLPFYDMKDMVLYCKKDFPVPDTSSDDEELDMDFASKAPDASSDDEELDMDFASKAPDASSDDEELDMDFASKAPDASSDDEELDMDSASKAPDQDLPQAEETDSLAAKKRKRPSGED